MGCAYADALFFRELLVPDSGRSFERPYKLGSGRAGGEQADGGYPNHGLHK
jgi:hypothetical protein